MRQGWSTWSKVRVKQAQDTPPRCLHISTLLCRLLVANSMGVNLDEPMRTLKHRLEMFDVI